VLLHEGLPAVLASGALGASFLVAPPSVYALQRAADALAIAADAWGGRYEDRMRWPPCGRVDARAEGVEVIARVIDPVRTHGLRTYLRAYSGEPRGGHVRLRRRTLPPWVAAAFGMEIAMGEEILDRTFAASEAHPGALQSFLSERLRAALRQLLDHGLVDELRYRHGAVELIIQGLAFDQPLLDSAFEVAIAAATWHSERSAYR